MKPFWPGWQKHGRSQGSQVNSFWNVPSYKSVVGGAPPRKSGAESPTLFSPLRVCTQLLKWPVKAHYLLGGGLNWSWNAERQWCAETWVNVSMSTALPHGIKDGINDNKLLCNSAIRPYISAPSRVRLIREGRTQRRQSVRRRMGDCHRLHH